MYLSEGLSGMRMREGIKGEYCYKEACSAGGRGDGEKQPLKKREAAYF